MRAEECKYWNGGKCSFTSAFEIRGNALVENVWCRGYECPDLTPKADGKSEKQETNIMCEDCRYFGGGCDNEYVSDCPDFTPKTDKKMNNSKDCKYYRCGFCKLHPGSVGKAYDKDFHPRYFRRLSHCAGDRCSDFTPKTDCK